MSTFKKVIYFVPGLTAHNLWELVEQYKTGKLRDYE